MTGARFYVKIAFWAATLLVSHYVPVMLVAEVATAICFGALCHALLIKFATWLYRKGDATTLLQLLGFRSDRAQFMVLVLFMSIWYLLTALHDHRSIMNIAAIELVFGLGVWLYLHRQVVLSEARRAIREKLKAVTAP